VKLLNLVLVGQPELADRLNEQSLRQLKQRITLRAQLTPLDLKETAAYIAGRLRIAGGNVSEILTKNAVLAIHEISNGLPRVINVIADNALMGGFASQTKPVDATIVREVAKDFDFGHSPYVPGEAPPPPAAPVLQAAAAGAAPAHAGPPDRYRDVGDEAAKAAGMGRGRTGEAPAFGDEAPRKKRFLFF
jgi:general secretion pathway protein A